MRRIPFVVALAVTTYLFLTPLPAPAAGPQGSDKVVHAALFLVLTLLGRHARLAMLPLALGLVAYAVGTEVLQRTLPIGRYGDVTDALADMVGIVLGIGISLLLRRRSG